MSMYLGAAGETRSVRILYSDGMTEIIHNVKQYHQGGVLFYFYGTDGQVIKALNPRNVRSWTPFEEN